MQNYQKEDSLFHHIKALAKIYNFATTKKAILIQNKLPLFKKYTTVATKIVGIKTRNSLIRIIIIKLMIISIMRKVKSNPENLKSFRIE